jgi:hypothetical protein
MDALLFRLNRPLDRRPPLMERASGLFELEGKFTFSRGARSDAGSSGAGEPYPAALVLQVSNPWYVQRAAKS